MNQQTSSELYIVKLKIKETSRISKNVPIDMRKITYSDDDSSVNFIDNDNQMISININGDDFKNVIDINNVKYISSIYNVILFIDMNNELFLYKDNLKTSLVKNVKNVYTNYEWICYINNENELYISKHNFPMSDEDQTLDPIIDLEFSKIDNDVKHVCSKKSNGDATPEAYSSVIAYTDNKNILKIAIFDPYKNIIGNNFIIKTLQKDVKDCIFSQDYELNKNTSTDDSDFDDTPNRIIILDIYNNLFSYNIKTAKLKKEKEFIFLPRTEKYIGRNVVDFNLTYDNLFLLLKNGDLLDYHNDILVCGNVLNFLIDIDQKDYLFIISSNDISDDINKYFQTLNEDQE